MAPRDFISIMKRYYLIHGVIDQVNRVNKLTLQLAIVSYNKQGIGDCTDLNALFGKTDS